MRLKWIDICDRFIPLLINLIYIILISLNIKITGLNILVNNNYFIATYIYLGFIITNYLISVILHKNYYFKNRSLLFLLFIIIGVSVSPKIGGYSYFHTFIYVFSILDILLLLFKMVYDSYYTEERLKNIVLPPNQFNKSRKILSRILNYSGFIIFFIICFIVFYYNEVKVTSILILLLVGLILISIIQIISMSFSVSPLNKFIKKYENNLNIDKFKDNLESLKETKLHDETLNLINILLWKYYSFIDLTIADTYKQQIFVPKYEPNIKAYFDAYFYYLLVNKDYDMIITSKKIFERNVKNKRYIKAIIKTLNNEKVKYKPLKNKFNDRLNNIYLELSSKLTNFNNYNFIKFELMDLKETYNQINNKLEEYYTLNEFKELVDKYNSINNKIIGAAKICNINMITNSKYYDDYKENVSLLYELYPLIKNINNNIINSRFKNKIKDIYGHYYLKHLNDGMIYDNYEDIKEDLINSDIIRYDYTLELEDKVTKLINIRNNIAKSMGYDSYLDILFNNKNTSITSIIDVTDKEYEINSSYNEDIIKEKSYKEYLQYLKSNDLYLISNRAINHTYFINNYRAPFISLNYDIDYNELYYELGKGYTYYLNNNHYIPAYLLHFSGLLNVVINTNNIDYIDYIIKKNILLYNKLESIYISGDVLEKDYQDIILDENPIDKLIACLMVKELYKGNKNLTKIFISLNRNLYKTSEKELFGSFDLIDFYNQYINTTN